MDSMINNVLSALQEDSRKGDFWGLVQKDLEALNIYMSYLDIKTCTKWQWKQLVKRKVRQLAFSSLIEEN